MSILNDKKTILYNKLAAVLPDYNIYNDDALKYESPYLIIIDSYKLNDDGTDNLSKFFNYNFDVIIGKDFSCVNQNKETIKEELRIDIEKIFALGLNITTNEIFLTTTMNNNNNTLFSEFTIIL